MINPRVFASLKAKAEKDLAVRAQLDGLVETLERTVAYAQGVLSRVHATPRARYAAALLPAVDAAVADEVAAVRALGAVASAHPYYKFNHRWTRHLQDAITTVLLAAWLGGLAAQLPSSSSPPSSSSSARPAAADGAAGADSSAPAAAVGRLLTLEEVGAVLGVPVEVDGAGSDDVFHVALEEYLAALTGLADELGRLAVNAVTLGDSALAVRISRFVKDLHAGFQLLNLKNDFLRKKVDGVKYAVKKVEGVIYDLALRGLLPPEEAAEEQERKAATGAGAPGQEAAAAPDAPADSKMSEA